MLQAAHPVLLVSDVVRSAQHYRDVLGFRYDRLWGEPPCFVMVRRGQVEIFLSQAVPPAQPRPNRLDMPDRVWDVYIRVSDGEALLQELRSRGARVVRDPETTFYEMREFEVEDPDGYTICFAQDVSGSPE